MAGGANILSVRTRALPMAEFTPSTFGEVVTSSMASMARQLPNTFVNAYDEYGAESARKDAISERFGQDYLSRIESEIDIPPPSTMPFFGDSAEDRAKQRRDAINARIDADIESGRQTNPDTWQGIQTTEELRQQRRERAISSQRMAEGIASRASSPVAAFTGQAIGAIGGAFTDPFNIATLPFGAVSGMRTMTAIGTEALANAAIEALQTPSYVAWQKELGVDLTAGDIATNILTAGAGGGVFAGLTRGIGAGVRFAGSKSMPILERMAGNKSLPAEVREGALNVSRARHVDENVFPTLDVAANRRATGETVQAFDQYEQVVYRDAPSGFVRNIDTPEFKARFEGSKAINDQGQPIVVYHGTGRNFDQFDATGEGKSKGAGVFFTNDPQIAGTYAPREGGNLRPSYLDIKNPLVVEMNGQNWSKIDGSTTVISGGKSGRLDDFINEFSVTSDKLSRWAKDNGYDGVIFKKAYDRGPYFNESGVTQTSDVYNVFSPKQVISPFEELRMSPALSPEYDVSANYTRPNNAMQSLRMETNEMDYQSLQSAFDADFERIVRDMPDMEIVNADGTVTSVKEIKADIAEQRAELQALRICGIGG